MPDAVKRPSFVVALSVLACALAACGGKIRDDGEAPDATADANDAYFLPEIGVDAALDTFEASIDAAPITPAVLLPHAVALIGMTSDDVAIVKDDSGDLVAAPIDGREPQRIDDASSTGARVFGHVAFSAHDDGTLVAWSSDAGRHVISSRSSVVGAVASDDGEHLAWLESHGDRDDFHVGAADGGAASLVDSVKVSSPCVHARAAAIGPYAIENACAAGATGDRYLAIDLGRGVESSTFDSILFVSVDRSATYAFVVDAARKGWIARLDGTARALALDDATAGIFTDDASAVIASRGAKNELVRIDVATGRVTSYGVFGVVTYGDLSADGARFLATVDGSRLVLVSDAGAVPLAGMAVGKNQFLGPEPIDASFTDDGAFVLFQRDGALRSLRLGADPASSITIGGSGLAIGTVLPSHGAQVVFSSQRELFVGDASGASRTQTIGAIPSPADFALTRSRRGVVWIEASGGKAGLNVAPLP